MAESQPDDDDFDDIDGAEPEDPDLEDEGGEPGDDELDDGGADAEPEDGEPDDAGADDGEPDTGPEDDEPAESDDSDDDDSDDDSLAETALLAGTMPMGMPGRKPKPQAAIPNQPGAKPGPDPHQPGPYGKKPGGQPTVPAAPGGKTPDGTHPTPGHPAPGPHGPKQPSGKGTPNGKGKGGNDGKALADALKELDAARKTHDAQEKPHSTATRKLVDSAKTSAAGLKPVTEAVKKSTAEHNAATKDHDEHEKQQGELDKALTGDGLGFLMKLVDKLQPVINKIQDFLNKLKDALIKAFEKALRPVADFFERVWSKVVVPAFQATVQGVSGAFKAVGNILGRVFDTLKKACATVVRAVGEVLKSLDFTVPSWVPLAGGTNLGLGKIGDSLIEWSTKMRDGGMVRGPGGPREDKVPVMMSNGEFVVNAASTAKHMDLLRAINNEANGIRSALDSGYAAAAKSLPRTAGQEARALTRSDRPQLVIAKPLSSAGDRLDRSLKLNISAPRVNEAHAQDSAAIARKSLTYSGGRR
ncbi:hypothetical protein VMT65_22450 [Nocardia sp. CDC153]|uniref:hypothetical protein n=1 Tax=Nocardia sp. CDC153 TaxID=3112167 RepID=UPI002DBB7830|nr:hypothetical protein [Nocardia sp. CDC153]MEC3955811.1 hypothetical protein [Nocardia sp. CDC153]